LFVDEIQEIKGFENVLRSLQAENECDIFCTGSNAVLLSGELSTYLSGRYIEFHIHSLSYPEFLVFHQLEDNDETLLKFLTYGGMPHLIHLPLTDDLVFEYLNSLYSTILLKDIVARENIRNVVFLENLSAYLADSVGSLFSAQSISKYFKSQTIEMSTSAILNYLWAMCNAAIINKVQRYDINKVTALGRYSPKDVVDIVYIREVLSFNWENIFNDASEKDLWVNPIKSLKFWNNFLLRNYRILYGVVKFLHLNGLPIVSG
jgi:uncharacterized protein